MLFALSGSRFYQATIAVVPRSFASVNALGYRVGCGPLAPPGRSVELILRARGVAHAGSSFDPYATLIEIALGRDEGARCLASRCSGSTASSLDLAIGR